MQSHLGWRPVSLDLLYSPASYNLSFSYPFVYHYSLESQLHSEDCSSCWLCLWVAIVDLFGQQSVQSSIIVACLEWRIYKTSFHLSLFNAFHRIPSLKGSTFSRGKEKRNKKMRNTKISLLLQLKDIS